ncbi:UbiA prenyltransferase family protein [Lunatibacter salilacus]|uniref:hypothetical protein n=1 Tax=Lunatibacter salilacus TaxID=2483804 RepID=UPI00131D9A54|nr:hypothetical protein [Lunatibacter salilacus]
MSAWLASFYRILHYLSIDVALGACAGMYFFARLLDAPLSGMTYLILALSVWIIYTFDHLLDAEFSPGKLESPRHLFHREYFKPLVISALLATGIVLGLAWVFLPSTAIFLTGAFLAAMILGGMLLTQKFKEKLGPFKEGIIAFLYVAGLLLLPLMQEFESLTSWKWIHFALAYLLLAWFNLVYLSLLDQQTDSQAGQKSLVSALGFEKTRRLLFWLGLVGLLYIISLFFLLSSAYHVFTLIVLIMFLLHVRYFLEGKLSSEKTRSMLEIIFFLPSTLILLA